MFQRLLWVFKTLAENVRKNGGQDPNTDYTTFNLSRREAGSVSRSTGNNPS